MHLPAIVVFFILTFCLLYDYRKTGKKSSLILLFALWIIALLMIPTIYFIEKWRAPMMLTKKDIVGIYEIDTSFYPGINSTWQHKHYSFTITKNDSLILREIRTSGRIKYHHYKISYSAGPPQLWKLNSDSVHHTFSHLPTLYRSNKTFYYVLHSKFYGNMFFRKNEN